jgi:hypothetical protein
MKIIKINSNTKSLKQRYIKDYSEYISETYLDFILNNIKDFKYNTLYILVNLFFLININY